MQPTTYFISDIHLDCWTPLALQSERDRQISERFFAFMSQLLETSKIQPDAVQALYILGDLFAFWIGDDILPLYDHPLIAILRDCANRFPIFFLRGNRDFLIGSLFAQKTGITVLPDCTVWLAPTDERILLAHGDSWCSFEPGYLAFRSLTRFSPIQRFFLSLPVHLRQRIAARLREDKSSKPYPYLDRITPPYWHEHLQNEAIWERFSVTGIIHGHIHASQSETHIPNQKLWVLGDWRPHQALILSWENGQAEPLLFSFAPGA